MNPWECVRCWKALRQGDKVIPGVIVIDAPYAVKVEEASPPRYAHLDCPQ